jgi:hypothetical protein
MRRSSSCFRGLVRRLPGRRRSALYDRRTRRPVAEPIVHRSATSFAAVDDGSPPVTRPISTHPVGVADNVGLATSSLDRPAAVVGRSASIGCASQSTKHRRRQSATIATMHRRRCPANTTTLHAFVVSAPALFGCRFASFSRYTGSSFNSIDTKSFDNYSPITVNASCRSRGSSGFV